MEKDTENDMDNTRTYREYIGIRDISPIMENHIEQHM